MAEEYRLVVIGAGPGGYVAAIRAAQLGIKTAVVEREYLGGVCLNWGCIPSKTLLHVTELKRTLERSRRIGLTAENIQIDLDRLRRHTETTVKRLTGGVKMLLDKAGVTVINGTASFVSDREIDVTGSDGTTRIESENYIIATGTTPVEFPMLKYDGNTVIGAREAIGIPAIPKRMLIVGAGPIGIEMATIYSALGAKVMIVEVLDSVLPALDPDISAATAKALNKQDIEIRLSSRVVSSRRSDGEVEVTIETGAGSGTHAFDLALVAAGMKPNTSRLDVQRAGVQVDSAGFIVVDNHMRTAVPHIYAVGDVVGGMLLAHKASHEGIVAAEAIAGSATTADWKAVPYAVFTDPEIAGIGLTETEATQSGRKIKVGKFPCRAAGKAVATLAMEGFVKVIADADTDKILGIHILAPHAGDIIFAGTALMEMGATAEDLGWTMAVHPTLSEALMEAALNTHKRAIHIPN
ncbi:MAG: dihydrolipoyl dehydrogenase [Phycisphaerae bacterium]|nr:dihydrolipoyl dehydrogenase [Phycisphaerae bacterium]